MAGKYNTNRAYATNVKQVKETIAKEDREREAQRLRDLKYAYAVFQCSAHEFAKFQGEPGQLVPAQMFCPVCGRVIHPTVVAPL